MKPGEYFLAEGDIVANRDEKTVTIKVSNAGDRPVQVGSHFHFFEANRALKFDRPAALGMRLNIPSGTAVRFEPGQTHEVELTAIAGSGIIHGFNALVEGSLTDKKVRDEALKRVQSFADGK